MADDMDRRGNVIVVSFQEDDHAYEALTSLKELDFQHQVDLVAAAVVTRDEDGRIVVKDEIGDRRVTGTVTGGVLGLLIGVLGGPLGILIGGATGLLLGSLFDIHDEDDSESVLSDIARSVQTGRTALLAEVVEPSPEVIDTDMARLSGTVLRRGVEEVEAEIAAAEDAQREAKKQARKTLREKRHAQERSKIHAKIEELKAKLHRHTPAGASSSST